MRTVGFRPMMAHRRSVIWMDICPARLSCACRFRCAPNAVAAAAAESEPRNPLRVQPPMRFCPLVNHPAYLNGPLLQDQNNLPQDKPVTRQLLLVASMLQGHGTLPLSGSPLVCEFCQPSFVRLLSFAWRRRFSSTLLMLKTGHRYRPHSAPTGQF